MIKYMLLVSVVILAAISMSAQEKKFQKENKFSFAVSTCPIIGFNSDELNYNDNGGLAITDYNLNMHFSYLFNDQIGITSTTFYSRQKINSLPFEAGALNDDHWHSYGIVAGPMWTIPIGKKLTGNVRAMLGVSNVSSSNMSLNGNRGLVLKEEWAVAMAVQLGTGLHYNFSDSFYLLGYLDLLGMRPKFKVASTESTFETAEQRITTLTLNGGIGFNF